MTVDAIVELQAVTKRFGGVEAITDVDLRISRGSVHALVGENGAGKSTLGKVVAGVIAPDEGSVLVDGRAAAYRRPYDALRDGIASVQQEIALVPSRTVLTNVFLGHETRRRGLPDDRAMRPRFREANERLAFGLDPDAVVSSLSVADQQKVEILRALTRSARLIVMDEPTAALSGSERELLLSAVAALRDAGTAVVYVSHNLDDAMQVADEVTVLRNGRLVETRPTSQTTVPKLVEAMLGRSLSGSFPARIEPLPDAPVLLETRGLARQGVFRDVSLEVRAGEIVALAGLVGSGRSEVARAIFGADRADEGEILLDGRPLRGRSTREAVLAGLAMLPESRKDQGLHMHMSSGQNASMAHLDDFTKGGVLRLGRERAQVKAVLERLDVRPANGRVPVRTLSGGNQQKVLFAKWLMRQPRVLIVDEPTRGVDVGAKAAIYDLIARQAERGMGVLMVSSELEEVLGLAHRVLVMRGGAVVAELPAAEATESAIMHAAFGTGVETSR